MFTRLGGAACNAALPPAEIRTVGLDPSVSMAEGEPGEDVVVSIRCGTFMALGGGFFTVGGGSIIVCGGRLLLLDSPRGTVP